MTGPIRTYVRESTPSRASAAAAATGVPRPVTLRRHASDALGSGSEGPDVVSPREAQQFEGGRIQNPEAASAEGERFIRCSRLIHPKRLEPFSS